MQTLEQWLEVATEGLCDAAAARVRAEIGEHYLSALESANSAGVDQRDAERRALNALGEAKVANRQYRRVLLTESEARTLSRLTSRWPPVVGILLLAPFAIYAIFTRTSELNFLFAFCVVEVALRAIPVSSIRAGWVVRVFRWGNVTAFQTMWFVKMMDLGKVPPLTYLMILFMIHSLVQTEYTRFVLRRKVPAEQWPRMLWI